MAVPFSSSLLGVDVLQSGDQSGSVVVVFGCLQSNPAGIGSGIMEGCWSGLAGGSSTARAGMVRVIPLRAGFRG